jgi:hypothetical protein
MPVTFSARGPIALPPAGPTLDADTSLWIAAVQADGGSVSPAQQGYVDALIRGLKTDFSVAHLNAVFDRIWLFAGESDAHQAKIDIVNLQSHTLIGTPTLAAAGYTGSTNNAINSNFIPNVHGVNYTLNSAGVFIYEQTNITSNTDRIGSANNSDTSLMPQISGTGHEYSVNYPPISVSDSSTSNGSWLATRTAVNAVALYKNANTTPIGTSTGASFALDTVTTGILCRGLSGTVSDTNNTHFDLYSPAQLSAAAITGGMTATQSANFANRINAYMISWGINQF